MRGLGFEAFDVDGVAGNPVVGVFGESCGQHAEVIAVGVEVRAVARPRFQHKPVVPVQTHRDQLRRAIETGVRIVHLVGVVFPAARVVCGVETFLCLKRCKRPVKCIFRDFPFIETKLFR